MADSAIPITAGTGTNVDTFTQADGSHRQAVILGDQDAAQTARVTASGALQVMDYEDVNRTRVAAYAEAVAGGTTDALVPLAVQRSGSALIAASTTALLVTTGKTFRLQQVTGAIVLTGTTVATTRIRLRYQAGGVVTLTSPVSFSQRVGGTTAIAAHVYPFSFSLPDGMDFISGTGVGVTVISTAVMHSLDLNLLGFEFTP